MKRLLAPLAVAVLMAACQDPAQVDRINSLRPDPGPYEEGPNHRAGFPCTWCHAKGGTAGPLDIAGTVYARPGPREALEGVQIHLFDNHGRTKTLQSNVAGNFFLNEGELELEFPIWVKLEYQGETTSMQTPIFRERSCSTCHLDPTSRTKPGHLFLFEEDE